MADHAADYDGIVIGAGHNGLTTAAYLTRAGLKIAVLERNGRIGGGTSTEDRILPGHRLNLHANFFMGWEFCPLIHDLDLVRYGYSYIDPPVQQAAVFRDFSSTGSDLGVSPGEFSLLTLVKENPGIHQKTLAQVHGLDKSTLSNAISDLKRRKLVRGVRDRTDRRFHGLWLTDFGQAVLARVTERIEAQERRMDLVLAPDERDLLLDLLRRLTAALS